MRYVKQARHAAVACLIAALGQRATVGAQIRASEIGSMSQIIDGTKLTVTYSRPRLRGREKVFGTYAAHWGETWTPGANWSTVMEVSKGITVNGVPLPKGKYSIWMVLREQGDWTTIFEPDWHRFHMEPPDSNARQIRVATQIDQAPSVDVLTWSMPELTVSGGTLAMQWGTTRATMKIGVAPSLTISMSENDARPYLGQYKYSGKEPSDSGKVLDFFVTYDGGTLKAHWVPDDEYMRTFAMIRVAPDVFTAGLYDKHGEIYEVLRPDMMFTFKRIAGRASTFEVRDDQDKLVATARRAP
jgi:hypothetical protein